MNTPHEPPPDPTTADAARHTSVGLIIADGLIGVGGLGATFALVALQCSKAASSRHLDAHTVALIGGATIVFGLLLRTFHTFSSVE